MKNIVFVWIALVMFALLLLVPVFVDFAVPFNGAIMLLGGSIAGYAGIKSIGVYQTAKTMPSGEGVSKETKEKLKAILMGLYVVILEALVIQYISPEVEIPLDDLFFMAAGCSAVILGGNQAIVMAEKTDGKK